MAHKETHMDAALALALAFSLARPLFVAPAAVGVAILSSLFRSNNRRRRRRRRHNYV